MCISYKASAQSGMRFAIAVVLCLWLQPVLSPAGVAQELSPRAFWPAPEGTRILTLGYRYTDGDTLTDPSLPVTGVNSEINEAFAALFQTFNLAGRTANLIVEAPYIWGETRGTLGEETLLDRDFDGLGDMALTLSANLHGAPSMDREAFAALRADPDPILGASLRVVAPTGDYNQDRVVNVGANRWAGKAELGYIHPINPRWLLEVEVGAWMFGDDDDFVRGKREQDPIYSAETHLIRRFRPGFWASIDLNYYEGGQSTVDGESLDDLQRTSKYGVTLVIPNNKGQAMKLVYSGGSASGDGNNFDSILVSFNTRLP
jgi:hypothetical protein